MPRQVVTGHNAIGKAIFLSDADKEPVTLSMVPGYQTHEMWSEKGSRSVPQAGELPGVPRYFPDADEVIFRTIVFPPVVKGESGVIVSEEKVKEMQTKLPGFLEHLELDAPGMHTTDSVDFGIVIQGEIVLELDDGAETLLTSGDCVIQNGTRHAWRNRSGKPVMMAFVLLGACRTSRGNDDV